MTLPSLDTIVAYSTVCFSIAGALIAALWISLIIWTFRDMRNRSRDPFAQILAALVVAILPVVGLVIYLILRPPETLAEAYERALEEEALLQEIEDRPACPGCSRTVDAHWILCPHCHTRLRRACSDCNALLELQWSICPYCGNEHADPYLVGPPIVLAEEIETVEPYEQEDDEEITNESPDFAVESAGESDGSEVEPFDIKIPPVENRWDAD
jgi:RNA polymerase subunit RPABC4/transcription elongation factor Spt4